MNPVHVNENVSYRPEIDGLRAIAVLSVVIYHADIHLFGGPLLSGGYLGVDIFFVISGYLITKILYREIIHGQFSIYAFYMRRARRILPALIFVILATLPFSWIYLLPEDFENFSNSITATIFFFSNVFFWQEAGYFDSPNEFKPLIHTWSLAVEEQFYLFFPLLLFSLRNRIKSRLSITLISIFVVSLLLAEYASRFHPSANFFLLPTRCWELFAGALLAIHEIPRHYKKVSTGLLTATGLAMIIFPVIWFTDQTRHPSLFTFIPIAGTCLVIRYAHFQSRLSLLLASKPMVGIGLLSYSMYLWHQPILAFFRLHTGTASSLNAQLLLVLLSIVLAFLSWKYIEQPFRRTEVMSNRKMMIILASCTTGVLLFAIIGISQQGYPSRFPSENFMGLIKSTEYEKESRKLHQAGKKCFGRLPEAACRFGPPEATKKLILLGDSHGGTLAPSLKEASERMGWSFTTNNSSSCPYLPGFALGKRPDCANVLNVKRREVLLSPEFNIVILHSRLQIYVEATRFDNQEGGAESGLEAPLLLLENTVLSPEDRIDAMKESAKSSVMELLGSGKQVVLVYPVPEVGWSVPLSLHAQLPKDFEARVKWLKNKGIHTSHEIFKQRNKRTYALLDSIGEHQNLARIYPENIFCDSYKKERCVTHDQKKVFYEDDDHLSSHGARLVVDQIMQAIEKLPR